jgi:type IV fimbrial biogenesis protein FimT
MVTVRRARGFTLPELMAGVAIMAILGAVAAPSMSELLASQRVKGASSDVFTALLRTRSEAIKRNRPVTLAPKAAGSWAAGWTIAHPVTANTLLLDHGAVPGGTIAGPASVAYLPNGRISGATAPSFDIQVSGSAQRRCISVDLSGRPFQQPTACATP